MYREKGQFVFQALNDIDEVMIAQAAENMNSARTGWAWRKMGMAAACFLLFFSGLTLQLIRYNYLPIRMGGGGDLGTIVNGEYYYTDIHKGIIRYIPGEKKERILKITNYSTESVTEKGIYFTKNRDRRLYFLDFESGKRKEVYSIKEKCSNLNVVGIYEDTICLSYFVEEKKGEYEEVYEIVDLENFEKRESLSFAPERYDSYAETGKTGNRNILLQTEGYTIYAIENPVEEYYYQIYCRNESDRSEWLLAEQISYYTAACEREWLYTCVPWGGGETDCYQIRYDEQGFPESISLYEEDITR